MISTFLFEIISKYSILLSADPGISGGDLFDLIFKISGLTALFLFVMTVILYARMVKLRKILKNQKSEHNNLSEKFDRELETLIKIQEDLEDLAKKYEYVLESVSNLKMEISLEEFLDKMLKMALKLVPEADWGSVIIIEDGKGRYKASVGFDFEILKTVEMDEEKMFKSKDVVIVDGITKFAEKSFDRETYEKIMKAGKGRQIYKTLAGSFWFYQNFMGGMYLDAVKPVDFSESSIRIFKFLVSVANIYLLLRRFYELEKIYHYEIINSILSLMNLRIPRAEYHAKNTAVLAVKIGKKMNLSQDELESLFWASILHDIGKIGIPDEILNKPTTLTDIEYDLVRTHVVLGEDLLASSDYLRKLADVIRHQCERWDGSGYPDGLSGENIPLLSRILHVSCAYNAMRTDKPFKKALTFEEAIEELRINSGKQFDPVVVEIALKILRDEDENWMVTEDVNVNLLKNEVMG